jgi:hypothetical protein
MWPLGHLADIQPERRMSAPKGKPEVGVGRAQLLLLELTSDTKLVYAESNSMCCHVPAAASSAIVQTTSLPHLANHHGRG